MTMKRLKSVRGFRRWLSVAFVAVFAQGFLVASAGQTANAAVTYLDFVSGRLLVFVNAGESVTVTCPGVSAVLNLGAIPTSPLCADVTGVTIVASGSFANIVDLSGMTAAKFTSLSTTYALPTPRTANSTAVPIYVDLGAGSDTFTGSELSEVVIGGSGTDTVNANNGTDTYIQSGDDVSVDPVDLGAGSDSFLIGGAAGSSADGTIVYSSTATTLQPIVNGGTGALVANVDRLVITGAPLGVNPLTGSMQISQWFAGGDGNDTIIVDSSVTMPTVAIGGGDNDALTVPYGSTRTPEVFCSIFHGSYNASSRDLLTLNTTSTAAVAIDRLSIDPSLPADPLSAISQITQSGSSTGYMRDCAVTSTGAAPSIAGGQFHPLTPYRIYDTRVGSGYAGQGVKVSPAVHNPVQVANTGSGGNAVPSDGTVSAVVLNVVGSNAASAAYLKVFPTAYPSAESAAPSASSLNLVPNEVRANNVTVQLGSQGFVALAPQVPMDVIVDVLGYYTNSNVALEPTGHFESIPPERIFDTRPEEDYADYTGVTGPTAVSQTFNVDVADNSASADTSFLGDDISAVVFNVTAIGLASDSYVTVWPAGAAKPDASNINVEAGGVNPNLVVVPVGVGGDVSFYTHASMHLVADVLGYFTSTGTYTSGRFQSTEPTRIIDTRDIPETQTSSSPYAIQVDGWTARGVTPIPHGAAVAMVANVTAVPLADGYVSVFPGNLDTSPPFPPGSNLNTVANKPVPNAVWSEISDTPRAETAWRGAPFSDTGQIGVYFQSSGYVVVDINGYFTAT